MVYSLKSASVEVDFSNKKISSIVMFGNQLIQGDIPFFAVKMRKRDNSHRIISASEFAFVDEKDGVATYTHSDVDVRVTVKKDCDRLLWRIAVKNKTSDLIELAEIMSFGTHGKLCDEEGGVGSIVYPYNEGALVTDLTERERCHLKYCEPEYPSEGSYSLFPNMLSSQFIAYLGRRGGVYLAFHDSERTLKHIDFRNDNGYLKMQMRAFCDVGYGEDYEMPFDGVMQFFDGEWQDACEIYRNWFKENLPDGVKPLTEQSELPSWHERSPIVFAYPVRGRYDTDEMIPNGLFPYENALPVLEEFSKETESSVMALIMHWEGTAPWAPPYVWPPYGGEAAFTEFIKKAHAKDIAVGLYCSGFGWTQRSNLIEYSREDDFIKDNISEIVCTNSDGSYKSVICTAQRDGFDMCPACDKTKQIFRQEADKMIGSGVDYIQILDQNHGGTSYFCYSDKHGHKPAPGKWMVEETYDLLSGIDTSKTLLGCESAAAEPYLSALRFSDNRFELNFFIGQPIPVYSYIYHEYVNNFMGNQVCTPVSKDAKSYPMRVAYAFTAGDMLTAVIIDEGRMPYSWGEREYTDRQNAVTILKNLNGWRRLAGREYLRFGKMVKPMKIRCGKTAFWVGAFGRPLDIDDVLTAAYEYEGKTAQFAVNYGLNEVEIAFDKRVDVVTSYDGKNVQKAVDRITVKPLSAVMIEI